MTISRRMFLGRSSVVGLAALFPLSAHGRNAGASTSLDAGGKELLIRLSRESFSENLNSTFRIQVSALNIQELELIEVSKKRTSDRSEAFDVVFRGPTETPFKQGTYMIHHARMGDFPVFVVPVGNGKNGIFYQAVYNRLA